jgi:hypothetical protein
VFRPVRVSWSSGAAESVSRRIASGYRDLESLLEEPGFAPLRGRRDFADLLADAAVPVDPFAPQ